MDVSFRKMKFVRVVIFLWRKLFKLVFVLTYKLNIVVNLYYNRLSDGSVISGRQISEIMGICTPTRQRYPLYNKFAFLCVTVCTTILGTKTEMVAVVVPLLLVLLWNLLCLFSLSKQSNFCTQS